MLPHLLRLCFCSVEVRDSQRGGDLVFPGARGVLPRRDGRQVRGRDPGPQQDGAARGVRGADCGGVRDRAGEAVPPGDQADLQPGGGGPVQDCQPEGLPGGTGGGVLHPLRA